MKRRPSQGCRPKKAVAKEVGELRARLSECHTGQWRKAQCIFDQMAALTAKQGPMGGKMVPRACRYCGYYGHSRQHCPRIKQLEDEAVEAELRKIAQFKPFVPTTDEEKAWCALIDEHDRVYKELCDMGPANGKEWGDEEWKQAWDARFQSNPSWA